MWLYLHFFLNSTVPHKHLNELPQLFFENKVTFVSEDVSNVCRHYIVKWIRFLLDFFKQARNESLVLFNLKILHVELSPLAICRSIQQESLNISLHEFILQ